MALRIPILAGLALCLRWRRRSLAQAEAVDHEGVSGFALRPAQCHFSDGSVRAVETEW
jgi:hypothetical protein